MLYPTRFQRCDSPLLGIGVCIAIVAAMTALRFIFASTIDLRMDEAYYWTWSKENVLSYLDHPPMVAWLIRLSTSVFGDTNFGVRFTGFVSMLAMQLLLADIVWLTLRDWRYVILVVLMPEAALDYGLLMTRITPDTALIPFELAMVWSLVRLQLSNDRRWWLLAGLFGGLALLSKYVAVLLVPAILAFALVPASRRADFRTPYPWLAALIALAVFSPVVYWNAIHDWASFKFQLGRPPQLEHWSAKFLLEFVGQQFGLVGPLLFPIAIIGTIMLARRGFSESDPIAILLTTSVLFPLGFLIWQSLHLRIGDSWPLFIWAFAFASATINLKFWRQRTSWPRMTRIVPTIAIVFGLVLVGCSSLYYGFGHSNWLGRADTIGQEAGFASLVAAADKQRLAIGATWFATTDYRTYSMLRWHLRDRIPVIQVNERSRYLGFNSDREFFSGDGLYVAQKSRRIRLSSLISDAIVEPLANVDLTWRGIQYDTYSLERLAQWKPELSPPAGHPLYVTSPRPG